MNSQTLPEMQARNAAPEVHQKPFVNVLLLGQTGIGKSTFINSLVNHLTFNEMEDAEAGDLKLVIPVSFVHFEDTQEITITYGKDDNEVHQHVGQSITRGCKCYQIPFDNYVLNLIDTPGVADTRGFEQDKKNLQDILTVIEPFGVLSGICIFLTPNEHRLTATFQFCLNYIFTQLSKSAAKNILFIFTNSRITDYGPGDTSRILRPEVEKLKKQGIPIKFEKDNCFYVDNECLTGLLSMKRGFALPDRKKRCFRDSWEQTRDECNRMMDYLTKIEPYDLCAMMSINEARLTIDNLSKTLSEIIENLEDNKTVLQKQKQWIERSGSDMQELKKRLKMNMLDVLKVRLQHKAIVCCSERCSKVLEFAGLKKCNYPQVCQNKCHLNKTSLEATNQSKLFNAPVMLQNELCAKCGCHYLMHMLIKHQTKYVVATVVDSEVQNKLNAVQNIRSITEGEMKSISLRLGKLEAEKNTIIGAMAKFAHFVNTNALVPYDDSLVRYLTQLIENEKKRGNHEAIRRLEKSIKDYESQIKLLQDSTSGGSQEVTLEEVHQLKKELFQLPNYGPKIKAFQKIEEDQKKMVAMENNRQVSIQVQDQTAMHRIFNQMKTKVNSVASRLANVLHVNQSTSARVTGGPIGQLPLSALYAKRLK